MFHLVHIGRQELPKPAVHYEAWIHMFHLARTSQELLDLVLQAVVSSYDHQVARTQKKEGDAGMLKERDTGNQQGVNMYLILLPGNLLEGPVTREDDVENCLFA